MSWMNKKEIIQAIDQELSLLIQARGLLIDERMNSEFVHYEGREKQLLRPQIPITLPSDWYIYKLSGDAVESRPGIYEWEIEGRGSYIGKYSKISRPTKRYGKNVNDILGKRPYHGRENGKFRRIHIELYAAFIYKRKITLTILENVDDKMKRHQREIELIRLRGNLNGTNRSVTTKK